MTFSRLMNTQLKVSVDRYYGESSPYDVLSTKNLQYLTLEQAIADLTYFAKNVNLPFDANGSSNADKAVSYAATGSSIIPLF